MKLLTLLAVAFLSTSAFSDDSIQAIQITNLPAGQNLNVFYANGRPAALDQGGSTPVIRRIFQGPVHKSITSSGTVSLPASTIPNNAPFWATDYVVLAVSTNAQPIYINNSDGSVPTYPAGMKTPTSFTNLANVRYIHLTDFPDGQSISFDFSQPLK
jgi:hypothetical protein